MLDWLYKFSRNTKIVFRVFALDVFNVLLLQPLAGMWCVCFVWCVCVVGVVGVRGVVWVWYGVCLCNLGTV